MTAVATSFGQSWWAVIVVALLTGVVLYQRWEGTHPALPRVLSAGERLRPVVLESLEGKPVQIDWKSDARPTVLYAFRPACAWCRRNIGAVQALAEGASPGYRFIGVSLTRDGLKEYLGQTPFRFPVYVAGPKASPLKLGLAPETLVISREGVVVKAWPGAYVARTSADIEKTFGFKLPDVHLE